MDGGMGGAMGGYGDMGGMGGAMGGYGDMGGGGMGGMMAAWMAHGRCHGRLRWWHGRFHGRLRRWYGRRDELMPREVQMIRFYDKLETHGYRSHFQIPCPRHHGDPNYPAIRWHRHPANDLEPDVF